MDKQKAYLKYKGDFEKISIYLIVLWAITIAGVLALIWGILGIILFASYVVVHVLKTKKEKEITLKITKEEFENDSVSEDNKEKTL